VTVSLPKRLAEELEKRGVDVEPLLIDFLVKELNLDPRVGVEAHLELASKYLEEGRGLVDKDPVQASEKLYKAAEETGQGPRVSLRRQGSPRRRREEGQVECGRARQGRHEDLQEAGEVVQVLVGLCLGVACVGLPRGEAQLRRT
jgi:hypothetical protein